jgi:hypothetical protein
MPQGGDTASLASIAARTPQPPAPPQTHPRASLASLGAMGAPRALTALQGLKGRTRSGGGRALISGATWVSLPPAVGTNAAIGKQEAFGTSPGSSEMTKGTVVLARP